ncbi:hypothetical protein Q8G38_00660 [Halomonas venusta]|uniref:hypothetical protein n=1 Tax=Vreelandella venusta TaxID=44935 RepID=UPI00295ECAD0|nr:hypothetical protein [Halomonas venusta]MDW0357820.1 hypothetical protein [Halomonas venusta]
MMYYQHLPFSLPDAVASDRVTITEVGQAIGHVPEWVVLNLPQYNPDVRYRNVVEEFDVVSSAYAEPNYRTLDNGEKVIHIPSDGGIAFRTTTGHINPERWSGFAYVNAAVPPDEGVEEYYRGQYFGALHLVDTEDLRPTINLAHVRSSSDRGFYIYENRLIQEAGQPYRLRWLSNEAGVTEPGIVMWTFSVENGLSIWFNGERKAVNTDDKRPLETGFDAFQILFRARGDVGVHGLLNIDLNAPENAGHRIAIEKFMAKKYGINS